MLTRRAHSERSQLSSAQLMTRAVADTCIVYAVSDLPVNALRCAVLGPRPSSGPLRSVHVGRGVDGAWTYERVEFLIRPYTDRFTVSAALLAHCPRGPALLEPRGPLSLTLLPYLSAQLSPPSFAVSILALGVRSRLSDCDKGKKRDYEY